MAKNNADEQFNFTWGLDLLDDLGYVKLYAFMLRTYARLGITRQEMLCLAHLASYHYNSAKGESRPGLVSIAHQMGYSHKTRVSELINSLEQKNMLMVTRRPGQTSIYDAQPFALKAYTLWLDDQQAEAKQKASKQAAREAQAGVTEKRNTPNDSVTEKRNTQDAGVTEKRNRVLRKNVTEEEKEGKEIDKKNSIDGNGSEEKAVIWDAILIALQNVMQPRTFDLNLRGSRLLSCENGTWLVKVRHPNTAMRLANSALIGTIETVIQHNTGKAVTLEFTTEEPAP